MTSLTLRDVLRRSFDVEVGPYSYGSLLDAGAADPRTTIGAYVSIGPGVRRFGAAHPLDELLLHPYFYNPRLGLADESADVDRTACTIEDGAWIGAQSVILPGCARIGVGAVVGAGAVVTRDVEDFAIVVGSPARVVRLRLTPEQRAAVLRLDMSRYRPEELASLPAMRALRRDQENGRGAPPIR